MRNSLLLTVNMPNPPLVLTFWAVATLSWSPYALSKFFKNSLQREFSNINTYTSKLSLDLKRFKRRSTFINNLNQGHPTTVSSEIRSSKIYYKPRYNICICSVILGELEAFRHYKGLICVILPKILDAIKRFTKVRIFLIPLSITFLNPKILGLLFLRKLA